jgi:hypothetical protein
VARLGAVDSGEDQPTNKAAQVRDDPFLNFGQRRQFRAAEIEVDGAFGVVFKALRRSVTERLESALFEKVERRRE